MVTHLISKSLRLVGVMVIALLPISAMAQEGKQKVEDVLSVSGPVTASEAREIRRLLDAIGET